MRTKPIQTFREGAIGLSVWQREGKAGTYFDFTVSRCFQKTEGEFSYSNSFHESNTEALTTVINRAAAWIEQHRRDAGIPRTARPDTDSEASHEAP